MPLESGIANFESPRETDEGVGVSVSPSVDGSGDRRTKLPLGLSPACGRGSRRAAMRRDSETGVHTEVTSRAHRQHRDTDKGIGSRVAGYESFKVESTEGGLPIHPLRWLPR